jgi:hypothetical protein
MNDLVPIESSEELKEFEEIKQEELRLTIKQKEWLRLYLDNSKTSDGKYHPWFGNKTQAALKAYNLNPETQYFTASKIAQQNYQKLSNATANLLEKQGISEQTLVSVAAKNMLTTKDIRWFEKVEEMMGMNKPKSPEVVVNQQVQTNYFNDLKGKYNK